MKQTFVIFVALESEFPKVHLPYNYEVYYTGVGKVNAAIKATSVLSYRDPSTTLVFNFGSAGSSTLQKNQIYKCTKFLQYDMDARPLCKNYETPFDNLIYPELQKIIKFDDDGLLCSTADKFQENPQCEIVDMESYSIAKVCKVFGFDFVAYKFISDDGNSEEWKENHKNGAELFLRELNEH